MESIKLQSHSGIDGILKIEIPVGLTDTDFEVLIVVQPLSNFSKTEEVKAISSNPKRDWPSGFFEQTAGSLANDPIQRPVPGIYEAREELL